MPDLKLGEACKPGIDRFDPTGCSTLAFCYEDKCRSDHLSIGTNVSGLDSRHDQSYVYCASYFVKDGKCALLPTVADLKLHASCTNNTECNSDGYTACCDGKCKPVFSKFNSSLFATIYLGMDIDAIRVGSSEMTKFIRSAEEMTRSSVNDYSYLYSNLATLWILDDSRPSVNDYPNLAKLWILSLHGRTLNNHHGKKCAKADAIPTFFPLFEDKITYEDEEGNLVAEGADGKIFTVTADGKLVAPIPIQDTTSGAKAKTQVTVDLTSSIVFNEELDSTAEESVTGAYCSSVKDTFTDNGIDLKPSDIKCKIEKKTGRRRLLAVAYELSATITVTASSADADKLKGVADNKEALAGDIATKLVANPAVTVANGGVPLEASSVSTTAKTVAIVVNEDGSIMGVYDNGAARALGQPLACMLFVATLLA